MNRILFLFLLLTIGSNYIQIYSTEDNPRNPRWAVKVTDAPLDNMYLVDEGVYRSEQPRKEEFPALQAYGIKEVLNLRNYHDNKDEAEGTDIVLHDVKMAAHRIKKESVIEALRIIKNRKGDILIHCQHGSDRTGTIIALYRLVFQNWTKEEAIEELKNGDYGYHKIFFNIVRFIKNADIDEIREQINK